MDWLVDFGYTFLGIFLKLTLLFILISFLVSWLQLYVSGERIKQLLNRPQKWQSYLLATGFGSTTPFCSCSTVPILVGLLAAKAPFGPSMAFLIASPLLNPMVVILLWSLLGWNVMIYYVIIMFVAAMLIGFIWEKSNLHLQVKNVQIRSKPVEDKEEENDPKWIIAIRDATSFFRSVFPYLLIGVFVASLIIGFVPESFITTYAGNDNLWAIPFSSVIGIPLYVRTSTLLPIMGGMVDQGMGLGAAVALIIGSTGASLPEVMLLSKLFKLRLLIAFVVSVLSLAIIAGFIFHFAL